MRNAGVVVAVVLLVACGSGAGRERAGDLAWHDGRWSDAVAAYRAAGSSARVVAKEADAALQGGMLSVSAAAWEQLAALDSSRTGEAAAGLARVAEAADENGDSAGLAVAIVGLRRIAPNWPVGRLIRSPGGVGGLAPADIQRYVPAALAARSEPDVVDPLLLALGRSDRRTSDCTGAVPVFEALQRRTANPALRDSAGTDLGWCELTLGLAALNAAHPGDAERWFERVVAHDSSSSVGRRALIGVGDARAGQGDSLAARLAWQSVATAAVPPDTITAVAMSRLQQMVPSVRGPAPGPAAP